ncbi:MAG: alpha/beta hydrolase [SAR202 cluster bacterium]|nr:alpha/beta hydrolase [SAR202 cluster bacterium]
MTTTFPKEGFADIHGLGLHYKDWGGQGQPLLLLHGLASNCSIFDLVAPHLVEGGCRVVAYDQRGHGRSDKPGDGYDFESIARDAHQFWDTFDLHSPVIVGHSWGGNVALQCAVDYPGQVAGLVMVDGGFLEPSSRPGWTLEIALREMAPPNFNGRTTQQMRERIRTGSLSRWWNPDIERIVIDNFSISPEGQVKPHLSRENHLKIIRAMWDQKPSHLYRQVQCPTLVLACRQGLPKGPSEDPRVVQVERARGLLPNADVRWLDDTIHDVPLQRPRDLAEIILGLVNKI